MRTSLLTLAMVLLSGYAVPVRGTGQPGVRPGFRGTASVWNAKVGPDRRIRDRQSTTSPLHPLTRVSRSATAGWERWSGLHRMRSTSRSIGPMCLPSTATIRDGPVSEAAHGLLWRDRRRRRACRRPAVCAGRKKSFRQRLSLENAECTIEFYRHLVEDRTAAIICRAQTPTRTSEVLGTASWIWRPFAGLFRWPSVPLRSWKWIPTWHVQWKELGESGPVSPP